MEIKKVGEIYALYVPGMTVIFTKYEVRGDLVWLYKRGEIVILLRNGLEEVFLHAFNLYLNTVYKEVV